MQDFVRVGVAAARYETGIGKRTLERMALPLEGSAKVRCGRLEDIDSARSVFCELHAGPATLAAASPAGQAAHAVPVAELTRVRIPHHF